MKKSVRLPAFAKINLRLHVLGKRPDGYHELRTIFQAISLHDTLTLSLVSNGKISLETTDADLPTGSDNLVYRALQSIRAELGFRAGIHAKLEKRIPVARGLGGGSSDAAAALIGAMRLSGKKLPLEKLTEIAASLGADVP
jgi:4-diphosphocytidyl-2-C-methyl-D-erythritol kinase